MGPTPDAWLLLAMRTTWNLSTTTAAWGIVSPTASRYGRHMSIVTTLTVSRSGRDFRWAVTVFLSRFSSTPKMVRSVRLVRTHRGFLSR